MKLDNIEYKSMNDTTFMIITESVIKHNKMIPDRSQSNNNIEYSHFDKVKND